MGIILAIDPHKRKLGYAVFYDDQLTDCGIVRTKEDDFIRGALYMSRHLPMVDPDVVTVEKMRVRKFWKGNPEIYIDTSLITGIIIYQYVQEGTKLFLPMPDQWKGRISKEEHHEQLKALVPNAERIMNHKEIAVKTLRPDVWDAIGLGLWTIEQTSKKE